MNRQQEQRGIDTVEGEVTMGSMVKITVTLTLDTDLGIKNANELREEVSSALDGLSIVETEDGREMSIVGVE